MNQVEMVKSQVMDLSAEELRAFGSWFAEFDAELWGGQVETNSENVALLSLTERALADYHSGRSTIL